MSDDQGIEQVEQLIERLEKDFRDLKIAVKKIKEERDSATRSRDSESPRVTRELEVGCKGRITNNIGPFQEREGKVVRINRATDRVTIQGKRRKGKVVRALRNVIRIEEYSQE